MPYLVEEDIEKYCRTIPGVTMTEITIASELIDGFKGKNFEAKTVTEAMQLDRRKRGRLTHLPIIDIEKIIGRGRDVTFGVTTQEISVNDIELDHEKDGRFTFYGSGGLTALVYGTSPDTLIITYRAGYEEYPEPLKIACAMLAQTIKQRSSFGGEKSIYSLDYRVEMTDDSFLTSDIKLLLRNVK